MKFLQLLCIALLLSAVLAAPQADSNATETAAPLKTRDEKIAEFKSEIEKLKSDGEFKDRGIFDVFAKVFKAAGNVIG